MVSPYSWGFSIWTVWVFSISLLPVFSNALHLYFTHRLPAWVVWKLKQMVAIPRAISNLSFRVIIAQWWGFSGLYHINVWRTSILECRQHKLFDPKIVVNLKCNDLSKITSLHALSYLGQCSKTSSILFSGSSIDDICTRQSTQSKNQVCHKSIYFISFDLPLIVSYHYTITLLSLAHLALVLALLASFSCDLSS